MEIHNGLYIDQLEPTLANANLVEFGPIGPSPISVRPNSPFENACEWALLM